MAKKKKRVVDPVDAEIERVGKRIEALKREIQNRERECRVDTASARRSIVRYELIQRALRAGRHNA